jgi:hypothetical protein
LTIFQDFDVFTTENIVVGNLNVLLGRNWMRDMEPDRNQLRAFVETTLGLGAS